MAYFKFLNLKNGNMVSHFGFQTWKVGKQYSVGGEVIRCRNGFHASTEPLDALGYVNGEVLAIVEASGDCDNDSTKVCYRDMKIVTAYRWAKEDSVKLAIFAAEQVLQVFEDKHPQDNRPRKAIEAARAWLADPTALTAYAASTSAAHAAAHAAAAASAFAAVVAFAAAAVVAFAAAAALAVCHSVKVGLSPAICLSSSCMVPAHTLNTFSSFV